MMQRTSSPTHNDCSTKRSQSTTTEPSSSRNLSSYALKFKKCLDFASTLLLPLMLGVFTVVITFHQQNAADQQRMEDRQLAREQREQDVNLTRNQREQDLNLSRYQREQDQELARLLREQDLNVSRLQRDLDRQIAENRRELDLNISQQKESIDLIIAEEQRMMSERQRSHERDLEQTRRQEDVFTAYIKDISMFLAKYNGSPTEHSWTAALMRVKTLTVFEQLDPMRKSYLVDFLYNAGQLTDTQHPPPIDLSGAELDNIDLSRGTHEKPMHGLSLAGAHLRNASFAKRDLSGANFRGAILTDAQFSPNAILLGANFAGANLGKANFYSEKLEDVMSENVSIINPTDSPLSLFIGCKCENVRFDNTILTLSDLSYANLRGATFVGAILDRASLFSATTEKVNFTDASMYMTNCAQMKSADASFYQMKGLSADFRKANLTGANFMYSTNNFCDFSEADMSYTMLAGALLRETMWSKTNLFASNLSSARLINAFNLTDEQLFSAVSIRNTVLPNGTFGRDKSSLIRNGLAVFNTDLINTNDGWSCASDELIVIRSLHNKDKDCVFAPALNATSSISMFQKLDLRKYRLQIGRNKLVLSLSAVFGNSTVVALEWSSLNTNFSHQHILNSSDGVVAVRLPSDIVMDGELRPVIVAVHFPKPTGTNDKNWCNDIMVKADIVDEE